MHKDFVVDLKVISSLVFETYQMRSDSMDLILFFIFFRMAEVKKELFVLQQQLKLVHQKHQQANKQYGETKQRRINLEKANKELEKELKWLKEL